MKVPQLIHRTARSFRNLGLFSMGALIVVLSVIWPRLFGSSEHGLYGADIANADAPGGGGCATASDGGGSTGDATGCLGGCMDACGDGGGGDCCGE